MSPADRREAERMALEIERRRREREDRVTAERDRYGKALVVITEMDDTHQLADARIVAREALDGQTA